ncbi:MAG: hypothetical protein WC710_15075 [Gallionella sp.]
MSERNAVGNLRTSPFSIEGKWRLLLCAMIAVYYLGLVLFPVLFRVLGLNFEFMWFLDSHALLAASDAAAAGLNPYARNPLDILGRPHVYSHWWLYFSRFGVTRDDNFLVGGFFLAAFFTVVFWWLRPRSFGEATWGFLIMASPAIVLGVERANNDLVIFALLALVIPLMASEREWVRWCALIPVLAGTLLKFYPAAAVLVLLMGESRREVVSRAVVSAILLGLVFLHLSAELAVLAPIIPKAAGLLSYGASQMFEEMGVPGWLTVPCGMVLGGLLCIGGLLTSPRLVQPVGRTGRAEWVAFVLGAVLLTACFFTRASYVYRFVYSVFMAPFLWRVWTDQMESRRLRRLAGITMGLMLVALWGDGMVLSFLMGLTDKYSVQTLVATADVVAHWRQPLIWAFITCLLCFLGDHYRQVWNRLAGR